jgi:hypothetical protein
MLRGGATDWTGELDALINLARLRGYYVRVAADGIFDVEEKLTGRCVCHGTAAQVRRWLRENTGEEQIMTAGIFEMVVRIQIDSISAKPMTMKDRKLSR